MLSLDLPLYALDYYTTPRPSPLSSRHVNACAQSLGQMKYSSPPTPRRNRGQAVSPLQHVLAKQDRRRKDFLGKVRQIGDDRKWRSRGDQVCKEGGEGDAHVFAKIMFCFRYFERIMSRGRRSGSKNRPNQSRKFPWLRKMRRRRLGKRLGLR